VNKESKEYKEWLETPAGKAWEVAKEERIPLTFLGEITIPCWVFY
jgi:hypothetical protein